MSVATSSLGGSGGGRGGGRRLSGDPIEERTVSSPFATPPFPCYALVTRLDSPRRGRRKTIRAST